MFDYSVITPVAAREREFYIVPLSEEDRYVGVEGAAATYEPARLDLLLEILNGYLAMGQKADHYETEHYRYSRLAPKGMLAIAVPRHEDDRST